MTEQINTPELRFPEFDGEWEEKKLGAEVTFYSGLTYKPDDINFEGTFVLRSSNIKNGKLVDADNVYVDSDKINCTFVNEGDVIVVVRNGSRNLIGKHARVNTKLSNTVIGAFMTGIRCYNSKFINSLLDTNNFYREIHRNLGATINQITTGNFKKMSFYFPDDKEKEKIGEFFGKLDRQIELEEEKLELLEQQKRGYMQKIFSQEMRFKDENNNSYPDWEIKKLEEIAEFQNGKAHENFVSNTGKFILVNSKFISTESKVKKYVDKQLTPLEINDIAIVMSDVPNGKALAKCYLIEKENTYSLNQRIGRIFNIEGNSRFLYTQINRNKQLLKYDSGVGQTNLKNQKLLVSKFIGLIKRNKTKLELSFKIRFNN
ncbi:restriction endonuclease subunit S [Staphylococcus epidermidis]|nr:restriction endonuclease subunit S [Staphylococcus epidermidis]